MDIDYKWGIIYDDKDQPVKWFFKVSGLDDDLYAVAYFNIDDEDPVSFYEANDMEILEVLIDSINTELYDKCIEEKNLIMQHHRELSEATVDNFM